MSNLILGLAIVFLLVELLLLRRKVIILESFIDAVQVYIGSMEQWYTKSEKWYKSALQISKIMDEHFELVKAQYKNVMEFYKKQEEK